LKFHYLVIKQFIEQEVLTIMMMKKLAIAGFVSMALSGGAFAVDCDGNCAIEAVNSAQTGRYLSQDLFVVNDFAFSVSSNVGLNSDEDSVGIAVGTASNKGRTAYTGSSNGGSVAACGAPTTGADIPLVPAPALTKVAGCADGEDLVVVGS
jgi:hypothetical protein